MRRKIKVKDKKHLKELINKEIKKNGLECDLNHLDISSLDDLSTIFSNSKFNGDISKWDTSNIKDMTYLFYNSKFNSDISEWNTSKVENMLAMFSNNVFDGCLSSWDVSKVKNMYSMFSNSKFNGDISEWDVSNVETMTHMFNESKFNGDISKWNVSNVKFMFAIFYKSKFDRYEDLNNWKPFNLKNNDIYNNEEKNKKVYWSSDHINLKNEKEDIKNYINKYLAEKEKQLLISNNININNLSSKKEKFKI